MTKKSELLMPAGSLEKLKIAILYGADAVYMGTPDMSLRTTSAFTLEEVVEGIKFAHSRGKRVYLTLNLFSHNKDIDKLPQYIETVRSVKPDGLIIADPGVFMMVQEMAPELELHISTQANICSWLSVKFWEKQGAKLCVLAREVSYKELKEIREKCPDVKLEAFIHGSMCMTYSGRCLLSNFMAERGANQGNCANSCRWDYRVKMRLKDGAVEELNITDENRHLFQFLLEEESRPGELMEIEESERGSHILNSKDLCLMPVLDKYLEIGIDSLKVEGRGKSPYYVAVVARAYRMAIDDYYRSPEDWDYTPYMKELLTVANRGYTLGFHSGRLTHHAHNYEDTHSLAEWELAGIVREVTEDAFIVEPKNMMEAGDVLEFVSHADRDTMLLRIYEFENIAKMIRDTGRGEITTKIHAGQKPIIKIPFAWFDRESDDTIRNMAKKFPPYTVIRKEKSLKAEEWERLKLDREAYKIEQGKGNELRYRTRLEELQKAIAEALPDKHYKTPRVGTGGCCGRGCNGCLVFWNDPMYEKARRIMMTKKQGEKLEREYTVRKKKIISSE